MVYKKHRKEENAMETKEQVQLLENEELREQLIGRIEVLDTVGDLLLLDTLEMATVEQVAKYFSSPNKEVSKSVIEMCVKNNREEIESDGYKVWKKSDFNETKIDLVSSTRTNFTIKLGEEEVTISNRGVALFPKRAILRVGMLLRDSEVAKELRTQLLNLVDNTYDENPDLLTKNIDEETQLRMNIGIAYATGGADELLLATKALHDYQQRVINRMKPKEEAYDKFMDSEGTYTVTNVCKMLGLKRSVVFAWLRENKLVFQNKTEATKKAIDMGILKQVIKDNYSTMVVTATGVEYIRNNM